MKDPLAREVSALLGTSAIRAASNLSTWATANEFVLRLKSSGFADGLATVRSLVWRADRWLNVYHKGDPTYRAAVIAHGVDCRATVMPEFRIQRSRVDVLLLTEDAHAVEIKSGLDNLARIRSQLRDYTTVAPRVSVISTTINCKRLAVDEDFEGVGLATLGEGGKVEILREARPVDTRLSPRAMLNSLRREEYVQLLSDFGFDSDFANVPNTQIAKLASETAEMIDAREFHRAFVSALKARFDRTRGPVLRRIPTPLYPAVLKLNSSPEEQLTILEWLDQEISDVHASNARKAVRTFSAQEDRP